MDEHDQRVQKRVLIRGIGHYDSVLSGVEVVDQDVGDGRQDVTGEDSFAETRRLVRRQRLLGLFGVALVERVEGIVQR